MPEKRKGFTDSFKETLKTVQKKAEKEGLFSRGTDILILLLLLLGIILTFFNIYWGALLVGAVVGFVFSEEILNFFRNYKRWTDRVGVGKGIVLAGALLFLLLALPTGVIAAIIAVFAKGMIPASRR